MTRHSNELYYQSIWFERVQHYSDDHLQIVKRKTLYFLHHWWWRYYCRKDSWNADSMSILNSWSIKLHSIWSRFAIHLYTMKVFANDWTLFFNCSSFIILKSTIKANESIRTSSDIFDSSVHICRTTDLSDYSWLSLSTITSCSQSSS